MAGSGDNKTKAGTGSVADFVAGVDHPEQRADSQTLIDTMGRLTGDVPVLWGASMIGFGSYHYRYESGREGNSFLAGFSPRKSEFSIYLNGLNESENGAETQALLARLGKHRMGKGCLYVKRLADIDQAVLEQLIARSVTALRGRYG